MSTENAKSKSCVTWATCEGKTKLASATAKNIKGLKRKVIMIMLLNHLIIFFLLSSNKRDFVDKEIYPLLV